MKNQINASIHKAVLTVQDKLDKEVRRIVEEDMKMEHGVEGWVAECDRVARDIIEKLN